MYLSKVSSLYFSKVSSMYQCIKCHHRTMTFETHLPSILPADHFFFTAPVWSVCPTSILPTDDHQSSQNWKFPQNPATRRQNLNSAAWHCGQSERRQVRQWNFSAEEKVLKTGPVVGRLQTARFGWGFIKFRLGDDHRCLCLCLWSFIVYVFCVWQQASCNVHALDEVIKVAWQWLSS